MPDGVMGKVLQEEQVNNVETAEDANNVMRGESRHQILGQQGKK